MQQSKHQQELQSAIREVLKRSAIEPEFRKLALRDSKAAFGKLGFKSIDVNVHFIENWGKSTKSVVLPDPVTNADQLSEEELEQVAGGCIVTTCDAGSCVNTGMTA